MDYPAYTRRQKSFSVGLAPATGEDGDFVQLRIVREKRKISQDAERVCEEAATTSEVTFDDAYEIYALPEEDPFIAGGPSCDFGKQRLEAMRKRLFAAVDEEDRAQVVAIVNDINEIGNVADVRDAETGQNVLHYATINEKWNIVHLLVSHCSQDILMSHYDVHLSEIQGANTALHIITEKNNVKIAKIILDKLKSTMLKLKLIMLETAPKDIKGQRPRLFSCLHLAAYYGHTEMVRLYLDNGMDVNHLNGKKDTALLWASRWGHNETVRLLLDRDADTEMKNDKGSTALHWAIRYDHPNTVALLLQHGNANPNTQRSLGLVSPIIIASAYGLTEIVSLLLQHPETDVNIRIRGGETAIHHAAKEGCIGVLEQLFNKGVNIEDQDDLGDTPLLLAAENGHVDIVQFLIKKGANINHRNHEGQDAWYYAMEQTRNDLLRTLVESSRHMDFKWRQPLCIAANHGKADKVEFLLNMNLDPLSSDADGNTFFHYAAMANKHEIIDAFHSKISINVQNNRKNTPLHVACSRGHAETITSILRCKAKADVINTKGETALHVAAYSRDITPTSVKELVDYTINTHAWEILNLRDSLGNNCLHIAGKVAKPDVMWEFRQVRFKDRDQDGLMPLHEAVRPGEPEALNMMLNIFETMSRDAKINEQSYRTGETVLHLAADECHVKSVKRLIHFGADISIKDHNGDTVLHRLTRGSVADSRRVGRHLEVLDVILDNIVRWWCIKENKPFPEEENQDEYRAYRREATLYVVNGVANNDGLSVLDQAFQVGAAEILSHLLMMPDITMFENGKANSFTFDLTGLTPRTSNVLPGCCGCNSISPLNDDEYAKKSGGMLTDLRLSGVEWLVTHKGKMQAAKILDLPPISMIEKYYTSMVSWTFALLMIFHMIYMSVFTYLGVDLLGKLREDSTQINDSDPQTILLYVIVPLEPILIVIYVVYTLIRYLVTRDVDRRSRLSKKRGAGLVITVIAGYIFNVVCLLFAVLVFTWIGLFTVRYEYQDYVLAVAICIGWLLTIAFTRGIKKIHYFYRMLVIMIVRDVVRFIVVYLLVLMAFGFAFHILFQVSTNVATDFEDPGETLFLTFNMMVGMDELFTDVLETNMAAVGRNTTYLKLFYLAYIIMSTVILLNLLIAMMNDSYQMILRNNQVTWRIESVALGIEMESNFPATKFFTNVKLLHGSIVGADLEGISDDRWYVTTSSSKVAEYMQTLDEQSGSQDAVSKRLDELEQRQVEMEKQTLQKLDHQTTLMDTILSKIDQIHK